MSVLRKPLLSLSLVIFLLLIFTCNVFAATEQIGIITGDVVNFRASPNTSSKIINQLIKGTKVTVTSNQEDWYEVRYSDANGWIHADYVTVRDVKISAGIVSGSVVNVRSKPDTSSEILTKLEKGTAVEIFEKSGDWYRISVGEERYGWIHSDYVTIREERVSRGSPDDTQEQPDTSKDVREQIVDYSKKLQGIKYVYGGSTTRGFDCSGFVNYVFKKFGVTLDRTSRGMGKGGTPVKEADLQSGDLVFFDTNGGLNGINHVGIYIGDNKFIHASSYLNRKVTISSLSDKFYSKTYMCARDYLSK